MIISQNQQEFERCGIFDFWNKGYTGKGIKVAEIERAIPTLSIFNGKLHDPFNISKESDLNEHGQYVLDIMNQILPDADLYTLPSSIEYSSTYAKGAFIEQTLPFIIKEKIDVIGASLSGFNNLIVNQKILEAQNCGSIFICSAGNRGSSGLGQFAEGNYFISIGALGINDKGEIYLKNYSSIGEELDFCVFSELYVRDGKTGNVVPYGQEGTSFSSPMFVGMIGLVQQFFYEKTGKKLNQNQMYQFVKDNCIDLGDKNFDYRFGHGLFILPNPDDIDVKKYIGDYIFIPNNNAIEFTIGSKEIIYNGQKLISDVAPFIQNGRTFLPVRVLSELLDCAVEWDEINRKVKITKIVR